MFSFFRKTRRPDDSAKLRLANKIADLLGVQLLILPKPSIEHADGSVNRKAIGYIYGYVDAVLTTKGLDMSDTDVGVPITFHVFRKLFPEQDPTKYVEFLMRNLNDGMVALGIMTGGQQYLDFQNPETRRRRGYGTSASYP